MFCCLKMNPSTLLTLVISALVTETCQGGSYKVTDRVFLDIDRGGEYLGRITIGLFGEITPKTSTNFKQIAANGINGRTYEGSNFHRVIERSLIQGGDIMYSNGSGSVSIYGRFFNDENFIVQHNTPGIVSMANAGPDTNGCQFFITTMQTPWLDGHHVAFGKVVQGQNVVHKIEYSKTYTDHRPVRDITIIRSGVLPTTPFYETDEPFEFTFWAWLKAGWIPLTFSIIIIMFFQWFMVQLK